MLSGIMVATLVGVAVFGVHETIAGVDYAQKHAKAAAIAVWHKLHKPKIAATREVK